MKKHIKNQKINIYCITAINTASLIMFLIVLFMSNFNPFIQIAPAMVVSNLIICIVIYIMIGAMWYYCKKESIISRNIGNYYSIILHFKIKFYSYYSGNIIHN